MNDKPSMFVNPSALTTPASAGIVTMLITALVGKEFGLPANWTALVISLLIATWVWGDVSLHWSRRLVAHFLNGFVIFMVASGVNSSALAAINAEAVDHGIAIVDGTTPPPEEIPQPRGVNVDDNNAYLNYWSWK